MNGPLISVCVPNLNTRPFLEERMRTILQQTYRNLEVIVSDNYSEDGAWEFFQEQAGRDARLRISQAPKDGLYPNWNNCIRQAQGKYVYVATSDDTMAAECLEEMVAALERHADCDLALCPLVAIDEHGNRLDEPRWPECTPFNHGLGELLHHPHVHRAPYDGLLHLMGWIVYNSITQLLIRRSLFSRIGEFPTRWGSVGDFNWEMKAGLVANTIYVPDTWASWRVHPHQATASARLLSDEHARKVEEMIQDAIARCESQLPPAVVQGLQSRWLEWIGDMKAYYRNLRERRNALARRTYQFGQMVAGTAAARSQVLGQLLGKPKWPDIAPAEIRRWLESLGLGAVTPV